MTDLSGGVKKWLFPAAGLCCFIAVLIITSAFRGSFAPEEEITPGELTDAAPESAPLPAPSEKWVVYVSGEVKFPGVYEMEPGSRVSAAIDLAGGFSRSADRGAVNLAEKLRDEAHISVPAKGEALAPQAARPPDGRRAGPGEAIDINRADAAALSALPGFGPKLSAQVVEYREKHGPFPDIESIRNVNGIGAKRFEEIKGMIKAGH